MAVARTATSRSLQHVALGRSFASVAIHLLLPRLWCSRIGAVPEILERFDVNSQNFEIQIPD